jgi:hypothetical protein
MSALALSCLIFVLTLGGILLGALLRRALPEHHLSKDSQDVVRLGVGLIGTIAALVLGLLIAAAKSSFDTQSTVMKARLLQMATMRRLTMSFMPNAANTKGGHGCRTNAVRCVRQATMMFDNVSSVRTLTYAAGNNI